MLRYSQTRLLVSSMAEAVRFYRDTLGLPIAFGGEDDVYSDFKLGEGITLGLYPHTHMAAAVSAELKPVSGDHVVLNFMVENLDKTIETLSAKGVKFLTPPIERPEWGMRTTHFRDPEGNLLELGEELPMSAQ